MGTYFNQDDVTQCVNGHIKSILAHENRIALFSPSSSLSELKLSPQELIALREQLTEAFHHTLPSMFFLQYKSAEEIANYFIGLNESLSPAQQTLESTRHDTDIAIIGMSGRFPDAKNIIEFWDNLSQGKDSVSPNPLHQELYHSALTEKIDITHCPYGASLNDVDQFDPAFFGIAPIEGALIDPQERMFLQVAWEALADARMNPIDMSVEARDMGVYVGVIWQDYQLIALEETCSSSLTALHRACQSIILGVLMTIKAWLKMKSCCGQKSVQDYTAIIKSLAVI